MKKSPPRRADSVVPRKVEEDTAVITFVVTRTGRYRLELQVVERGMCPRGHEHFGFAVIGDSVTGDAPVTDYEGDPRWPSQCRCGFQFTLRATSRVYHEPLFAKDDGKEYALRELPPGATFEAWWTVQRGPKGEPWWVVCMPPHGGYDYWEVYARDERGGGWYVTGTPPRMTVRQPMWRGHITFRLKDGVITKVRQ